MEFSIETLSFFTILFFGAFLMLGSENKKIRQRLNEIERKISSNERDV